jgi:ribosome biogenesis protein ERB1
VALHPKGDNLIVGSGDCKVHWFDLDLSEKPYKTFKYHKAAVEDLNFHNKYPMFLSSS